MTDYNAEKVSRTDCQPWQDEQTLRHYYYERELSLRAIGDRLGVSGQSIRDWMDKHGLERRGLVESHMTDVPEELTSESTLRELLIDRGLTREQVADRLGVSQPTVTKYALRHGIESIHSRSTTVTCAWCEDSFDIGVWRVESSNNVFCSAECQGHYYSEHQTGEDNPSYKGGHARGLYHAIANAYQERGVMTLTDHYRSDHPECYMCGENPTEQSLDAHHIVPIMAGGTNDDYNFMSLCRSCHHTVEAYTKELIDRPILRIIDEERQADTEE